MGGRARREAGEHSALGERFIAGVPARIMRPRLVFIVCLTAILAFGLLMVYSASSRPLAARRMGWGAAK